MEKMGDIHLSKPTPSLTFSYFPHIPSPPSFPLTVTSMLQWNFPFPFISFPFLQTLAIWRSSRYNCCAAFTVAPCWELQRAAQTKTHWGCSKFVKHENRIFQFFFLRFNKNKIKQKWWTVTDLSLCRSSMALANASSDRWALSSAACALCSSASWVPDEWTDGFDPSSPHSSSMSAQTNGHLRFFSIT